MGRFKNKINRNLVINDHVRLFLLDNAGDCCCGTYGYHSCIGIGDISRSKGSRNKIYCPSDEKYGEFDIVQSFEGEQADGTISFNTHYTYSKSQLEKMYDRECLFTAQIHFGSCTSPDNFSEFEKVIILSGVSVNSYGLSNLFASQPSERNAVNESVEATFYDMCTVVKPSFGQQFDDVLNAGPIIDSFAFCDDECCLCPDGSGIYHVQLVDCGTDCTRVRIIYNNDCNNWQAVNHPACDGLGCNQNVNKNLISDNDGYHYIHLNGSFSDNVFSTLSNAKYTIPVTALLNNSTLLAADGQGNKIVFVGENGYVFVYNISSGVYEQFTHTDLPLNETFCAVKICSDDNCQFVVGGESGQVFHWDGTNLNTHSFNTIAQVHHVAMPSCCSILASIEDTTYISCNGNVTETNLMGYVTAIEFANQHVGYAVSQLNGSAFVSMSVDGGNTWAVIDSGLDNDAVYTSISICNEDLSQIIIGGQSGAVSDTEAIDCTRNWGCDGSTGISYVSDATCQYTLANAC